VRDTLRTAVFVLAAFVLYSLLGRISPAAVLLFNFFSLVVFFFAVEKGEVYGACLGAVCGLIQDSLSLRVFGVSGMAKTLAGYLAGNVAAKVNVLPMRRQFVFLFLLTAVEYAVWAGLYSFLFSEKLFTAGGWTFLQPLATAALGTAVYPLFRKLKAVFPSPVS